MTTEINSHDARALAGLHGEVVGAGDARADGGWDFIVENDGRDLIVSIVRGEDGELDALVA